jgi:ABC-2 type transport system permease protein
VRAFLAQIGPLAQRSIVRTFRRPPLVAAGFVFPLILYAFTYGSLGKAATKLPGFPTSSYATFALGLTFAYAGIYATTLAGGQVGDDVQTGFVKRLSLTRLSTITLLLGQLVGIVFFAIIQGAVFLGIGFALGAHVKAGVGGAFLVVLFGAFNAITLGTVGMMAALRVGSGQAVAGLFPVFMASMFLSSMNMPRDLIRAGWFRTIATYNPLSYLMEAPRSLLVSGWKAEPLLLGLLVGASIFVPALLSTAGSLRALSVRR